MLLYGCPGAGGIKIRYDFGARVCSQRYQVDRVLRATSTSWLAELANGMATWAHGHGNATGIILFNGTHHGSSHLLCRLVF